MCAESPLAAAPLCHTIAGAAAAVARRDRRMGRVEVRRLAMVQEVCGKKGQRFIFTTLEYACSLIIYAY